MPDSATLIAALIDDAVDGVRSAETDMEISARGLSEALRRPPEELVTDAEVEELLRAAYPDPDDRDRTVFRPGVVYPPATAPAFRAAGIDPSSYAASTAAVGGSNASPTDPDLRPETVHGVARTFRPPVTGTVVNVVPTSDDRDATGGDEPAAGAVEAPDWLLERAREAEIELPVLTERAVERVRRAVAHELGCRKRDSVEAMLAHGLPRAVTETMDVRMKVSFDESLDVTVPDYREADVGIVPEAIGSIDVRLRFDRGG